ncbi:two-component regulator propeller domain-containing protein [Niabella aquatica]
MWIGAGEALNRFDGKEFRFFKPVSKNSAHTSENDINCLLADQANYVWVGTSTDLLAYDTRNNRFKEARFEGKNGRTYVYCLAEDSRSNIWVGTSLGLYRLKNRKNFTFEKATIHDSAGHPFSNLRISSIFCDGDSILWAGTSEGLVKIKFTGTDIVYTSFKHDPQNPASISSNAITSVTADKYHNLWVGTQSQGINLFHKATGSFTRIHTGTSKLSLINNFVRVIRPDTAGNIWIGTQEGLTCINWHAQTAVSYQNDPVNRHSLSQNSVHSIFVDKNNLVWIGTYFGGINLINPFPSEFRTWKNNGLSTGLSNNVVSSIASDLKGNLWIGTEGGGMNYYNRPTKSFTYYTLGTNSVGSNLIKTIYRDRDGNIWAGTHAGGLNLYRAGAFKKYFYTPDSPSFMTSEISTIAEDHENNLWLGIQGGIQALNIYRRQGINLTDISNDYNRNLLKGKNIKKIFSDSRNNTWIATSSGLFIVKNGHKIVDSANLYINISLQQNLYITCIQEDSQGNIWFGIEGGGLKKYNPAAGKVYAYLFRQPKTENDVYGILEDTRGLLWVSTKAGLIKLEPSTGKSQLYTKADGLPSNTFNYNAYFKDDDGMFYFGGYNGLISFAPLSFFSNTLNVPIVFTGLKTLNQPKIAAIDPSSGLKLTYNQNVFTIEFALLNYIKPEKNRYAYILKGFDTKWIETDKPAVTYMNLKPGKYTLVVKGANNDGKWSPAEELAIEVLPPVWRTWWAYVAYIILFGAILFFIIRYFYLQELIKKEEALHQNKLDFFTNVTHEIRTHLTLIMSPVDKMIEDRANDNYLQQQFQHIKKNAGNLLRLSEELMDFRKAETEHMKLQIAPYDIVAFVKEIYEYFTEISLARDMHISFTHDIQQQILYFDKEQLEKVFFNLISNAFKFTPDGGRIDVHITEEGPYIKVTVTDNGRGIAPEYKDKLFNNFFQVNDAGSQNKGYGIGLALSSKIAALHGARIEVASTLAEETNERKTTFAVFLQKGFEHFNRPISIPGPQVNVAAHEVAVPSSAKEEEDASLFENYIGERQLSILVVDDNPDIRSTIHEILSSAYNVILKEDAATGWLHASEQLPDIIISDVMMPNEDGLSFCNRIKSDVRTCHIPVILLTAKTTQQDHIDGLYKGADLYLTKPFNRRILELNVRNLLATRERVRERVQQYIQQELLLPAPKERPGIQKVSNPLDDAFLNEVLHIIEKHLDEPEFNVALLAQKVAMSIPVLYKKMKAVTNLSVNDFIKSVKLQKAAEMLQQNTMAVYEVCYAVGFQDRKHFSLEFKKKYGLTPKQYALSYKKE